MQKNEVKTTIPNIPQTDFMKEFRVNAFDAKMFMASIAARLEIADAIYGKQSSLYTTLLDINERATRLFDQKGELVP